MWLCLVRHVNRVSEKKEKTLKNENLFRDPISELCVAVVVLVVVVEAVHNCGDVFSPIKQNTKWKINSYRIV